MNLRFPLLGGGISQGLNDAGIETFEGDYAHFVVRESIQNSLDAAASHKEPVRVEFTRHKITAVTLPFIDDLRTALRNCQAHWSHHAKPKEFFGRACELADELTLNVLKISDYGTQGVAGEDDDDTKPWFGLVRSRGVSIKGGEDSGGSFGIGKDAPLAASALRTVIYSTRTPEGNVAVQGIARLATHKMGGELTQGTGFIGIAKSAPTSFTAIREPEQIPGFFQRKEPGLDVFVLGFRENDNDWENAFIAAALCNFWPAIHFGRLVICVGEVRIDSTTLAKLMHTHRDQDAVKETIPYYRALTTSGTRQVEGKLPFAGACRLHVCIGDRDFPRKVCMTRRTGMVIYYYAPRSVRIPFSALFCCDDIHGNAILKALEPPCHDDWQTKRAQTFAQRSALREIKEWIRASLRQMIPDADSDVINESAVAELIPDDLPGQVDETGENKDLGGQPLAPRDINSPEPPRPAVRRPGEGTAAKGPGLPAGAGEGDTSDPDEGDSTPTGGKPAVSGGENPPGGGNAVSKLPIELRSFRASGSTSTYHLVARSTLDHTGDMLIEAVTEDGNGMPCAIDSAYHDSGATLAVSGNVISGITINAGIPLRLSVQLKHPMRFALRASTP